jgi:hypothetical protein
MHYLEKLNRLCDMYQLILQEATGNPEEFAGMRLIY